MWALENKGTINYIKLRLQELLVSQDEDLKTLVDNFEKYKDIFVKQKKETELKSVSEEGPDKIIVVQSDTLDKLSRLLVSFSDQEKLTITEMAKVLEKLMRPNEPEEPEEPEDPEEPDEPEEPEGPVTYTYYLFKDRQGDKVSEYIFYPQHIQGYTINMYQIGLWYNSVFYPITEVKEMSEWPGDDPFVITYDSEAGAFTHKTYLQDEMKIQMIGDSGYAYLAEVSRESGEYYGISIKEANLGSQKKIFITGVPSAEENIEVALRCMYYEIDPRVEDSEIIEHSGICLY